MRELIPPHKRTVELTFEIFKKDSRAVRPLTFSETDATFKKANIIVKHVEKESTFVKALQRSSY